MIRYIFIAEDFHVVFLAGFSAHGSNSGATIKVRERIGPRFTRLGRAAAPNASHVDRCIWM